ncbi:MAG: transposase [Flavobacteriales bacterium]|nr:transposase [Flavobacteriales bacterium]
MYTQDVYREIFVDSVNYCIKNKGLVVHAWVLMTNHAHLLINSRDMRLEFIIRDLKRHTSKATVKAIAQNVHESRDWMIYLFGRSGEFNPMNEQFQFGRTAIIRSIVGRKNSTEDKIYPSESSSSWFCRKGI